MDGVSKKHKSYFTAYVTLWKSMIRFGVSMPYEDHDTVGFMLRCIHTYFKQNLLFYDFKFSHRICTLKDFDMDMKIVDVFGYNFELTLTESSKPICEWKDFISFSSVTPYQTNLEWNPRMKFEFKTILPKCVKYCMTSNLIMAKYAYHDFTNTWPVYYYLQKQDFRAPERNCRLQLIELDPDIEKLDDVRYNVYLKHNNGYNGGECLSWHRYTKKPSIPFRAYESDSTTLIVEPIVMLTAGMWHAWVFCNLPKESEFLPAIYDDHIIPFLPNKCDECRSAVICFLTYMKSLGQYGYSIGRIIARNYVWTSRFDNTFWKG